MKKLFLLSAVFCLLAVSAFAQKGPDFSGTWTLDTSKSKLDERARARVDSITMTVTQTAKDIKVETATKQLPPPADAPQGGMGRGGGGMFGDGTSTYTLDGKETAIQQDTRMGPVPVKLTGSIDSGKLHLSRVATFNGPSGALQQTVKETWSISGDGKTLTVEREMTSPRGTNSSTLVFVKK